MSIAVKYRNSADRETNLTCRRQLQDMCVTTHGRAHTNSGKVSLLWLPVRYHIIRSQRV